MKIDISDPINKILYEYDNSLGHFKTQQEEETMTDNITTKMDTAEFKPVPTQLKLTDAELEQLLNNKPFAYITDADETADEAAPTIH